MSTPMFEREPIFGPSTVTGQSHATYGAIAPVDLFALVEEATRIDEVLWAANAFSSLAGELLLFVEDVGNSYLIGSYPIPAGTATLRASGRIDLDLVLPVGWKLTVSHNVTIAGPTFTNLGIVAQGGVVR